MSFIGGIFGGIKNLAGAVKNAAVDIVKLTANDLIIAPIKLMAGGKFVVEKTRDKIQGVLNYSHNWVKENILGIINKKRKAIKDNLGKKFDEKMLLRGAKLDKEIATFLESFDKKYGASDIEVEEKKPLAKTGREYRKWNKEMNPRFDRFAPDIGSDKDMIKEEKRLSEQHKNLDKEEKTATPSAISDSDQAIISSMVGILNSERRKAGVQAGNADLKISGKLSKLALRRSLYLKDRESELEKDHPGLEFLLYPPEKRSEYTKELSPIGFSRGAPQFDISEEERLRFVPDSLKAQPNGKYKMTFYEKDNDFANRIRAARLNRMQGTDKFEEMTFAMDYDKGDYPGGDARMIVEKLLKKNKAALIKSKKEIGIGIARTGTKVVITVFFARDEMEDKEKFSDPIEEINNEWWFNKIPEKERAKNTPFYNVFYGGGDPEKKFDSGYSLYQVYLFKKKIDNLRLIENREISFVPEFEYNPQENILSKQYPLLHIKVRINDEVQVAKLIKGTDLVDIPQKRTSKRDPDAEKSVGKFITLDEYFEEICPKPVHKEYIITSDGVKERSKGQRQPEEERENSKAGSEGEDEDERYDAANPMGLSHHVPSFPSKKNKRKSA